MPGSIPPFDPFAVGLRADPYRVFDDYRSRDPVHWGRPATPGIAGTWYLTRHDDVTAALRDPRLGREARRIRPGAVPPALTPLVEMTSRQILSRDPPDHTRLRSAVAGTFTSASAEALRARIADIANTLLDRVVDARGMDVIADYAGPLPLTVVSEIIGIPPECRERFREWSNDFTAAVDARESFAAAPRAGAAIEGMSDVFRPLIAARRQRPGDDVLSTLACAGEGQLTDEEIVAMCCLLLVAGHETTVNLIGNGLLALLRHPEQLERLRADPALLPGAVEELLRYDSPVLMTFRYAMEDLELRGRQIRRGDSIGLIVAAANRDPERFERPEQLDILRADNRHVSFGRGIHACLGAPLAKLEAHIALGALLTRLSRMELASQEIEWRPLVSLRGLRSLPITFTPADSGRAGPYCSAMYG